MIAQLAQRRTDVVAFWTWPLSGCGQVPRHRQMVIEAALILSVQGSASAGCGQKRILSGKALFFIGPCRFRHQHWCRFFMRQLSGKAQELSAQEARKQAEDAQHAQSLQAAAKRWGNTGGALAPAGGEAVTVVGDAAAAVATEYPARSVQVCHLSSVWHDKMIWSPKTNTHFMTTGCGASVCLAPPSGSTGPSCRAEYVCFTALATLLSSS